MTVSELFVASMDVNALHFKAWISLPTDFVHGQVRTHGHVVLGLHYFLGPACRMSFTHVQ